MESKILTLGTPEFFFRKFPRDPSMRYPWDKPKDPSTIKNGYLKYPFTTVYTLDSLDVLIYAYFFLIFFPYVCSNIINDYQTPNKINRITLLLL